MVECAETGPTHHFPRSPVWIFGWVEIDEEVDLRVVPAYRGGQALELSDECMAIEGYGSIIGILFELVVTINDEGSRVRVLGEPFGNGEPS